MPDISKMARELQASLPGVPLEEIATRLDKMVNEYRVPEAEARRSILNLFSSRPGGSAGPRAAPAPAADVKIKDISAAGQWVNLRAKVIQLWEPRSASQSQVGLLGDETGTMKFVAWAKSGLPKMEEGRSYELRNLVTDAYQGRASVKMNRTSSITPLETEVEVAPRMPGETGLVKIEDLRAEGKWVSVRGRVVQLWESNSPAVAQAGLIGDESGTIKFTIFSRNNLPRVEEGKSYELHGGQTDRYQERMSVKFGRGARVVPLAEDLPVRGTEVQMEGAVVEVLPGSGYIKRCPQCSRALQKGLCVDHGKVEGVEDLRVKAVMDDGLQAQDILLNREATERWTGVTLEVARQKAAEALDAGAVVDDLKRVLFGRYFRARGPRVGQYLLVESLEPLEAPDPMPLLRGLGEEV
ncbi:MAG: replication protein A [Euryarchaeota archaeon]|nr:replication protein A [Euryarchaeota archaeon]